MKISIITISYNSASTIEDTIRSVINQNYDNLEYIIIDGGSTDSTLDIIKQYQNRIDYFVSEKDEGISDAFNKGIYAAKGDYIGIINSDDFLAEDALANINNYAERYINADVLYGDMVVLNQNGWNYICKPQESISSIKHHFMICHPSVFVKKQAYRKYGLFDLQFHYAMDYELLSRFYIKGAVFQYIPVTLSFFRKGGTSKQNAVKTVNESIEVSVRNGTKPVEAKKYYQITNQYQRISDWMGKMGIESFIRRIVKGQQKSAVKQTGLIKYEKLEVKKRKLLFIPTVAKDWIGGVYYIRNIVFSMLENKKIIDNYEIHILAEQDFRHVFEAVSPDVKLHSFKYKNDMDMFFKIIYLYYKYRCNLVYSIPMYSLVRFGIRGIFWIPDFQHNHLPEYFSKDECAYRNARFQKILGSKKNAVVLSSFSALDDAKRYYSIKNKKIHIVHFVSYIENEIQSIEHDLECQIMLKYGLKAENYICVANQFWKHKNHIVVARAIKLLEEKGELNIDFVFTGEMEDYRNPAYIDELKETFQKIENRSRIKILGFLPRSEQICIMKNSLLVIQPSLFEGWGTVLEDCKVLDKTVLLSNIKIHLEQKNEHCILFDPYDEEELALKILEEQKHIYRSDVKNGIIRMHKDALRYSSEIESLLNEFE